MSSTAPLAEALRELGYTREMRQERVCSPASGVLADIVAFTHFAPQDLRTSAISAFTSPGDNVDELLETARLLATPFALVEGPTGDLGLYSVTSTGDPAAELLERISPAEIPELRSSKLADELAPRVIRAAKAGTRQLTLFPMDARLLINARDRSVGSITSRLEESFKLALEDIVDPTSAARLVIESLAAVIVWDKYRKKPDARRNVVETALRHHGEYFEELAQWESTRPHLVESVLGEIGNDVDYRAIDARSINAVYEKLFLTPELRQDLGIFHTDQRLASRILDQLPIEEIPPEDRYVVDPACGAGNLLLAAQERLENLSPGKWSPVDIHEWLKTHMYGADIEPIAVEIAKLSLLVSSLPLGNSWQIEERDALDGTMSFPQPPTVWVTNPPWRFLADSRKERALEFLEKAVEHLAEGGLLACILPAPWLSTRGHKRSRREISARFSVFEVWRLPRDMFEDARVPAAVVFAQKRRTAQRSSFAFRWVTASSKHRADFLDAGTVQFQSTECLQAGEELVGGPVDDLAVSGVSIRTVATLRAGVRKGGEPCPASSGEGVPVLEGGAPVSFHRPIRAGSITWVSNTAESYPYPIDQERRIRQTPKLLVQADRFADNAWRVRPVVDLIGVVPSGSWQIVTGQPQAVWALNAFFSTSIASCFVHSHSVAKRIAVKVLAQIPLPPNWCSSYEHEFAELGLEMAAQASDLPSLIDEAERLARQAFELDEETVVAIERIMAGYTAPDGRVRFPDVDASRDAPDGRVRFPDVDASRDAPDGRVRFPDVDASRDAPDGRVRFPDVDASRDAPDGRVRFPDVDASRDAPAGGFNQAPGTVLRVERKKVHVWVLGGPDEGFMIDLHEGMPGWLLEEEAAFDLTGDPQTGRYRFHRAAYLANGQSFGLDDE